MNLTDLINKYLPKSIIEILFYMRRNYLSQEFFTIEELGRDLKKPKGSISRDLNKLEKDKLIQKKYIAFDYRNGNRLQIYLTKEGLELSTLLLLKWLNRAEQEILKINAFKEKTNQKQKIKI